MSSVQVTQAPTLQQTQQQQTQQQQQQQQQNQHHQQQQQQQQQHLTQFLQQLQRQNNSPTPIINNSNNNNNNNNASRSKTLSPNSLSSQSSPINSPPTKSPSPPSHHNNNNSNNNNNCIINNTQSPQPQDTIQQQPPQQTHLMPIHVTPQPQPQQLPPAAAPSLPPPPPPPSSSSSSLDLSSAMPTALTTTSMRDQRLFVTNNTAQDVNAVTAQRLYDNFPPVGHASLTLNGYSISRLPPLAAAAAAAAAAAVAISPTHNTIITTTTTTTPITITNTNLTTTNSIQASVLPTTTPLTSLCQTSLHQSQPKKSAFCIDALLAKSQTADVNTTTATALRSTNTKLFTLPNDERLSVLHCVSNQQHRGLDLVTAQQNVMNNMTDQETLQHIRDCQEYGTPSPDGMSRSESPNSSHRSSPPISPGCEEQQHISMRMDFHDEFKKPVPPHSPIRPQDFPLYTGGHPYQLLAQGGSAFHRPLDPAGKPIPVI